MLARRDPTYWFISASERRARVKRRTFLARAGLAVGGAAAGSGAGFGYSWAHQHYQLEDSGHAVGSQRPDGPLMMTSLVYRVPTTQSLVALSFDDGPSTQYTAGLLAALDKVDAVATFFEIGEHVKALPALSRDVAARHEIGNHTWNHPDMSLASAISATDQLTRGRDQIHEATGHAPTLFRPPFGRFSGATAMIATSFGYPIMLWQTLFDVSASAAQNVARLSAAAGPGTIILGHDGGPLHSGVVTQAVPDLVKALRDKGLEPVTLSTLLAAANT
jgi:peptidoglycan/xylan/chitin deacetylase (PgdA/CDA1 family)